MTFPRADSDLFMYLASLILFTSCSPRTFSLPARSINVNWDMNLILSISTDFNAKLIYPYLLPPIYYES